MSLRAPGSRAQTPRTKRPGHVRTRDREWCCPRRPAGAARRSPPSRAPIVQLSAVSCPSPPHASVSSLPTSVLLLVRRSPGLSSDRPVRHPPLGVVCVVTLVSLLCCVCLSAVCLVVRPLGAEPRRVGGHGFSSPAGSNAHGSWATADLQPASVNRVLLGHSPARSFGYCTAGFDPKPKVFTVSFYRENDRQLLICRSNIIPIKTHQTFSA